MVNIDVGYKKKVIPFGFRIYLESGFSGGAQSTSPLKTTFFQHQLAPGTVLHGISARNFAQYSKN